MEAKESNTAENTIWSVKDRVEKNEQSNMEMNEESKDKKLSTCYGRKRSNINNLLSLEKNKETRKIYLSIIIV